MNAPINFPSYLVTCGLVGCEWTETEYGSICARCGLERIIALKFKPVRRPWWPAVLLAVFCNLLTYMGAFALWKVLL